MAIIPDQAMPNPFLTQAATPMPMPAPAGGGGGLAALLQNPQVLQQLMARFGQGMAQPQAQPPMAPPQPMPGLMPPPMAQHNPGFRVPLPAPVNPAAPQLPAGPIGFARQPAY